MRNDQRYSWDSMNRMKIIYEHNNKRKGKYINDESKPRNIIYTAGNFPLFAFHPRDHIFWGHREDLIDLFNIPLELRSISETVDIPHEDYWKYHDSFIRTESYIGAHYAAKFHEDVRNFLLKPQDYLYDNAPFYNQALDLSNEIYKQMFCSFPRQGIDLEWPKYNWWSYPYDTQQANYCETWAEDDEAGILNPLTVKEPCTIENYHKKKPASFYLYQSCPISACIRRGYIWEEHQHELIDKYVKKDSVVVEVGAHVGTATVKLSKVAKQVHAFEPFKASFNLLNQNLKINDCKNVKVYSEGLSDTKGKNHWSFLSIGNPGGSGMESDKGKPSSKVVNTPKEKEYEINTITLDSLKLKKVDYIKIDVEGFEYSVLRGAMKTITKHKPIIVVESFVDLQDFGSLNPEQVNERFKDLLALGYTYEYVDDFDFLFLPKGYKS
jgi:FkbM family methyltransferase